jgi:hypothetical protein
MDHVEREIERIDEGGDAWAETDEVLETVVRQPLDTIVPVRLTAETSAELRRDARKRGVGPSTLIRMWILEKLQTTRV